MAIDFGLSTFVAGQVAQHLPTVFGLGVTGVFIQPLQRSELIDANVQTPNVIPPVELILSTYYAGGCTKEQRDIALRHHGISSTPENDPFLESIFWQKAIDVQQPRIPIDMGIRAAALGTLPQADLDFLIKRYGFRNSLDREFIASDSIPLDSSYLMTLLWRGEITESEWQRYMKHAGYRSDAIRAIMHKNAMPIPVSQALQLFNRGIISAQELQTYIHWSGLFGVKELNATKRLGETQPTMRDILDFTTRKVFDPAYVARMQLDNELTPEFDAVARQLGYGWLNNEAAQSAPGINSRPLQSYFWRAHWATVSPLDAATMLHRLRPTGGINNGPRIPNVDPFTQSDYITALSTNNIAPGIRDQLSAVSYNVPQRLIVKRLYSAGIIDRAETKETIKDQGYDDATAEKLTQLVEHETIQAQVNKLRPVTMQGIKSSYKTGTINRNDAARYLQIIYLEDYGKLTEYLGFAYDAQVGQALDNQWVVLALQTIETEISASLVDAAIKVVHKSYLRGEVNANTALGQLAGLGIVSDRARYYVQLWSYELAAEGSEATAAQLSDYYVNGLIDQNTLAARLSALHYSQPDISMIIARQNLKLSQRQAKLLAAQQKVKTKEAAALAKQQQLLIRQQQANAKQLCRSASKTQLAKWASNGLVSYASAFTRLLQCGMSKDDIVDLFAATNKMQGDIGRENIIKQIGPAYTNATSTISNPVTNATTSTAIP